MVANGTPSEQLGRLGGLEDLVLVVSPVNLGFGGGCNLAAETARGALLVLLNDDSRVESGSIEALAQAATDPTIGAVGSCILSEDGSVQEAGSVLWSDGSAAHVGAGSSPHDSVCGSARDVDFVSANGLAIRRDVWELVGGFDERFYPAYFEDVDLCLTLARSGFRVRFEPEARLVHLGSRSTAPAFRSFLLDRNRRLLIEKWGSALELFDPRPPLDEGRTFDAAVARAVERSVGRRNLPAPSDPSPADSDVSERSKSLEVEYRDYLERTVVETLTRLGELEMFVAHRPDIRVKRWIGAQIHRWRP